MPLSQPAVDVDDWEDEDELLKPTTTGRTSDQTPNFALRQRLIGSQRDSRGTGGMQPSKGAHTLQAYCLGCLGQYIEELLLCGQEVLPLLPPDAKACLMAIARRRGLLDNKALEKLIDSSLTALDIAHSQVTDAALQNALQTTPNLLSVDVTGCQVSQRTVRSLGTWCPQLQVLRLGSRGALDDRAWAINMKHIMPSVTQQSNAADSWEALSPLAELSTASAEEQNNATSALACLSQLTYLVWPQIPAKTSDLLARRFPKVVVNPKSGFCSTEADQKADLDEQFMQLVAPFWQQEEDQEPEEPEHVVPLSERFRMAYISRAQRIAAKSERNYQQRKRRELRNNTVLQALARFKYL